MHYFAILFQFIAVNTHFYIYFDGKFEILMTSSWVFLTVSMSIFFVFTTVIVHYFAILFQFIAVNTHFYIYFDAKFEILMTSSWIFLTFNC